MEQITGGAGLGIGRSSEEVRYDTEHDTSPPSTLISVIFFYAHRRVNLSLSSNKNFLIKLIMKKIMSNLQGFFPESVELVIMMLLNINMSCLMSNVFFIKVSGIGGWLFSISYLPVKLERAHLFGAISE